MHTHGKDKSTTNYGVSVRHINGMEYYGFLQQVIQLTYVGANAFYKTILLKCDWFNSWDKHTQTVQACWDQSYEEVRKVWPLHISEPSSTSAFHPTSEHKKGQKCMVSCLSSQGKINNWCSGWWYGISGWYQWQSTHFIYTRLGGRGHNGHVQWTF